MEMMMKFTCLWTLLLICHILSKKLECGTAMHVGMLELKMAFCSKISCFWEVRTEGQLYYSTFYRDPEVVGALFHSFLDYHSTIYWVDKIALLVMVASYAYFQTFMNHAYLIQSLIMTLTFSTVELTLTMF